MATKSNIKMSKQEENLSETNIKKVIAALEPAEDSKLKPITKTLACQMLCISYNVKRLDTIIAKFKENAEFRDRQMKAKRGTPATNDEIAYTIRQYMRGDPVAQISRELFRGVAFINSILESNDVPKRPNTQNYFKPELIPEGSIRTAFSIDEIVYSTRYDSLAKIKRQAPSAQGENVYAIYLLDEKWNMNAYQPASELASLDSIKKLGINV